MTKIMHTEQETDTSPHEHNPGYSLCPAAACLSAVPANSTPISGNATGQPVFG